MLKSNNKGFTLMELIIVMAVIGILILMAVPNFQEFRRKAEITKIKNDSRVLRTIVSLDNAENPDLVSKDLVDIKSLPTNRWYFLNSNEVSYADLLTIDEDLYLLEGDYIDEKINTSLPGNFYLLGEDSILYIDILTKEEAPQIN